MTGVPRLVAVGSFEEKQFKLAVLIVNSGRMRELGLTG